MPLRVLPILLLAWLPACAGAASGESPAHAVQTLPAASAVAGAPRGAAVGAAAGAAAGEGASTLAGERVIKVSAQRFAFTPALITLQAGVPVVLELTSLDRRHGFLAPELHIDAEIVPGSPTLVHLLPREPGTYSFHCSVFCGDGREDMAGRIVVMP